jgi:heptosyltransferase-2
VAFPRVLVKLPNWIGDAVMAGPLVAALKAHFAGSHLALLARDRVRAVAERLPGADEVISEPPGPFRLSRLLRDGDWDLAISCSSTLRAPLAFAVAGIPVRVGFSGGGRDALLTLKVPPLPRSVHQVSHYLALASAAGVPRPVSPRLAWSPKRGDAAEAGRFLSLFRPAGGPLVAMAPGASFGPAKRWFPGRFAVLSDRLVLEHGMRTVLVGGPEERPIAERIASLCARRPLDACGRLSLGGTAALLKRCAAFVSNDSGLLHVGAAVGVRTVGLFGSSNPHWTGPFSPRGAALWGRVQCSPCYRRTCLPGRRYACLDSLSVDRVAAEVVGAG